MNVNVEVLTKCSTKLLVTRPLALAVGRAEIVLCNADQLPGRARRVDLAARLAPGKGDAF
jgi:hypothetical protein